MTGTAPRATGTAAPTPAGGDEMLLRNWPLSGLRVRSPLIELRWPSLRDLDGLASRGAEGVHDPSVMPFFSQWTDGPAETVAHRVMQRHWSSLGAWRPDEWTCYLVVVHEGTVVGSQSIGARHFAVTRDVLLTAWLGLPYQGRGIGGHARGAMLHLAFEGLGALRALSVVRQDNLASQGVCRKFAFRRDGTQVNAVRGERVVSDRWTLDRETFLARNTIPFTLSGVEPALPMFGVPSASAPALPARPAALPPTAENLSGIQFAGEFDCAAD